MQPEQVLRGSVPGAEGWGDFQDLPSKGENTSAIFLEVLRHLGTYLDPGLFCQIRTRNITSPSQIRFLVYLGPYLFEPRQRYISL
jgi:hypothetical protein